MRHPAPGRSQSAGQTPLFFNYSYLKTNKKYVTDGQKSTGILAAFTRPEREPPPWLFRCFGFFPLRISMFLFPKETRISLMEPGTVTGCLARRLRRGRLFFPFWKGKEKKKNTGGERLPWRARLPAAAEPA